MSRKRRVRFALAVASVAAIAISGGSACAQVPNPYHECESWGQLPEGRAWGYVTGVGIDHHGNVWVVDRCGARTQKDPCVHSNVAPIMEFDSTGKFLKSFGAGMFVTAHSLYVDKDDNVWVADDTAEDGKGDQVIKFSPDGKVLLTLGKAGVYGVDLDTFSGVVDMVVAPNGDIFVADGHQHRPNTNTRIMKFSKDGKFIKAWGKPGTAPGEFHQLHAIAMDSTGRVFVGDRANARIQIFDQDGKFLEEWRQFGQTRGIFIDANDTMYVTNLEESESGGVSDIARGIRIASAKDGVITGFIPPTGPELEGTGSQERVVADAMGNLYVADFMANLRKCVKK
jgi:streptogramin lyase